MTWTIADTHTSLAYVLALTKLGNFRVHITLTSLSKEPRSAQYLSYLNEVMSCHIEVTDYKMAMPLARWIMQELETSNIDVANPIELAIRLGADLHGQPVEWPNPRAH